MEVAVEVSGIDKWKSDRGRRKKRRERVVETVAVRVDWLVVRHPLKHQRIHLDIIHSIFRSSDVWRVDS